MTSRAMDGTSPNWYAFAVRASNLRRAVIVDKSPYRKLGGPGGPFRVTKTWKHTGIAVSGRRESWGAALICARCFPDDPHSGLAEVLAERFLLPRSWVAGLLFQLVGLPQCFVGFCALLCHTHSLRPPDFRRHPLESQTAPLPITVDKSPSRNLRSRRGTTDGAKPVTYAKRCGC